MNKRIALRKLLARSIDFAKVTPGLHLPVNTGHLLIAILENDSVGQLMLHRFGLNLDALEEEIHKQLKILINHPEASETICQDPLFSGEVFLALHHAMYRHENTEPSLLTVCLIEGFVINPNGIANKILRNMEVDLQRIQAFLKQG